MKANRSISSRALGLVVGCALLGLASSTFAASTWSNLGATNKTGADGATPCRDAGTGLATDKLVDGKWVQIEQAVGNALNCTALDGAGVQLAGFSTAGNGSSPETFGVASLQNYGKDAIKGGIGVLNDTETLGTYTGVSRS